MDRVHLEELLADGLSLAEIGRRVGRHEATVGYWVGKHGLSAVNRARHLPRGGIPRERLQPLADSGMSIAEIASELGRSRTTVRHWLKRYGLKTRGALARRTDARALEAREQGLVVTQMSCRRHGETAFILDRRGYYRCKRCRSESVARRRRRVKELLVSEAGGACCVCGYSRHARGLHFHHVDPALKRLEINARGAGIALERLRQEAGKCVLLCANCHAEVEAGLITLPSPNRGRTMAPCPDIPG